MESKVSSSGVAAASTSESTEEGSEYNEVLIIGAGLAGLATAKHLVKNGLQDLRILEARNRVGGRVLSVQIGHTKAELGATWIHGVLGNPLYEIAATQNLLDATTIQKPQNVAATTESGRRLPLSILQEVYEAYFWFFKRCEEYFLCKNQPPEGVSSVGQHIELEISIYLQRFSPHQRRVRRQVFNYLLSRECCITGASSLLDVGLAGIGSYAELPGGNVRLPHGYASVLGPLLAAIPDDAVLKGQPVRRIYWKYGENEFNGRSDVGYESDHDDDDGGGGSAVAAERGAAAGAQPDFRCSLASSLRTTPHRERPRRPNVAVETEDGRRFYCERLVCTIPLGVLVAEENADLFQPRLPRWKRESMSRVKSGVVNKIFLEYAEPFLTPEISEIILLWDDVGDVGGGGEEAPLAERWFRKIYSFSKVSETLLLAWISGEEAKYVETLKMSVVADKCTELLRKFLADPLIPRPKSCIFTAWFSQPFSMGSYSYLGVEGLPADIEKIAQPMCQKHADKRQAVVYFAGEACHPSFYSTGHGAYLSGRMAAQDILDAEALKKPHEETVYNLSHASVADISSWLQELQMGSKSLDNKATDSRKK